MLEWRNDSMETDLIKTNICKYFIQSDKRCLVVLFASLFGTWGMSQ